ncbi:CDP-glycerol glycerophosphotransferase family protein [Streptosporangium sp. NPDC087985]|uniref:bifunctional glycosyltransferase/CDP-glycerol:glycerophosphate glycerophosphotransferase n=1 Tax=Streptosporangium sp. NPDC087985 TaxID=3366196 RepID=UPI003800D4FA
MLEADALSPLLSIVVPFFNVEPYLEECLTSIARQTLRDSEVICVDDGSLDGSAVIAKAFAEKDHRFRVIHQENAGLGPARNAGALHATGEYLCFVDSDDVLPVDAHELLVSSLRGSGSDFACGNVLFLNSVETWRSGLHSRPFRETVRQTHVNLRPELLLDRTAWNKVFRHDFYREHGFSFPAGLYEDAPVTIPAHVLARSVDVLGDVVYCWRQREAGDPSITQSRTVPGNLEDRIASITRVQAFLSAHASPALRRQFDEFVLRSDLTLYVNAVLDADEDYRERLVENAGALVERMDPGILSGLPWEQRLVFELLRRRRTDEFTEVLAERQEGVFHGMTRRMFGWYADHPMMHRGVLPKEVFRAGDSDFPLVCRVDQIELRDGGDHLRVSGRAYIRGIDLPRKESSDLTVTLRNTRTERVIELPVQRLLRTDVTATSRRGVNCYDWSGFEVDLDLAVLAQAARKTRWQLEVQVTAEAVRRSGPLTATASSDVRRSPGIPVLPGVGLHVDVNADDEVLFRVQPVHTEAEVRPGGEGTFEVSGWVTSDIQAESSGTLLARLRRGGREFGVPARCVPLGGGRAGFSARLPVAELLPADPQGSDTAGPQIDPDPRWDLSVTAGPGRPRKLAAGPLGAEAYVTTGDREVGVVATALGPLSVVVRPIRPLVTEIGGDADDGIRLTGRYAGVTDPRARLVLREVGGGGTHHVPLEWEGERFSCVFPLTRFELYGEHVPLTGGRWEILVESGGELYPVRPARSLLTDLPAVQTAGTQTFRVRAYRVNGIAVDVRPALGAAAGNHAQRRLAERDYPAFRKEPLRDLVVFESWQGRHYSGSPRAIYEELRRRGDGRECVWISADGQVRPPGDARVVLRDSRDHYEVLAQAGHVISNGRAPSWFTKRDGQVHVRTWHGTPLKRVAHDIAEGRFSSRTDRLRRLAAEVARWDLLISPSSFGTSVLPGALRYGGPVLESGRPGNDLLHRPGSEEAAARVRRALGIPPDRRVVLHAPTWRDDQVFSGGRHHPDIRLNVDRALQALGDDHVLLFRDHPRTSRTVRPISLNPRFADVTRYPDVTDLLLIADVLITDYSSLMFDYAGTGRPMIFFARDLEHYRQRQRGFYFDPAEHVPGPLPETADEVIDVLADLDGTVSAHAAAYRGFRERFCRLDDGNAAARVVDHVFRE